MTYQKNLLLSDDYTFTIVQGLMNDHPYFQKQTYRIHDDGMGFALCFVVDSGEQARRNLWKEFSLDNNGRRQVEKLATALHLQLQWQPDLPGFFRQFIGRRVLGKVTVINLGNRILKNHIMEFRPAIGKAPVDVMRPNSDRKFFDQKNIRPPRTNPEEL